MGAGKHLGMPKDLVAGDGAVAWSATHSAYERVVATYADETSRARYGTAINSPFRLLGQVADDDAELCFTRYRCFDPEIGSWISSDPLEVAGGLNLYGFDGAPTDVVDPLGLATGRGNPHKINFSQRTVGENVDQYTADMKRENGWDWNKSGPLRVMNVDGQLVSYDNRRLMAARAANLQSVPIEVVDPNATMPGSNRTWAQAFERRRNDPRNRAAGGAVPTTGLSTPPRVVRKG
ncbi:MAG: RHS repeat-associated core domain-containing protein [Polyangiaceae bacterium]